MYDPLIGRFLQVDPERQYASPYMAMGNNPLRMVDPTGGMAGPGDPIFGGAQVITREEGGCNCSFVTEGGIRVTNFSSFEGFDDYSVGDLFGADIQFDFGGGPVIVNPADREARAWLLNYVSAVSIVAQPMVPRMRTPNSFSVSPRGFVPKPQLAFGLNKGLESWARSNGLQTYRSFTGGGLKLNEIQAAIKNPHNQLHFNLDGFSRFQFNRFDPSGKVTIGNITNWELHTIRSTPGALQRTTFWQNGSTVPTPSWLR